ncbi:Penicillin binding family protein [Nitrospina gracilis 3/211]|uniref:peptidoglycan glycosyltransferase n=1 Tax=Nitrospina gracilis (strain 3/211) TaxID=1266370 RepID=M1YH76_NITG3|nr:MULTISPECIES: penicillin-binding protein 1C [Nitrospina]MCF8722854.1 penicillin-binding protein 1C [Nitrospina sp. Nb-3]CCQ89814.1 Penicillin binding family protein [Nitrospina gracilis 3/211]
MRWRERSLRFKFFISGTLVAMVGALSLFVATATSISPVEKTFLSVQTKTQERQQVTDRYGAPLRVTYQTRWNTHDTVPLHAIPDFLKRALIVSEDKRFYEHTGIDWLARLHAVWQNVKALGRVRGASTLTEQVVRILHPRPRTVWSRWMEGFEAQRLETALSKSDILELYLNQVPYASQRRGVAQAAHYYFNRDLDTLTQKEMLALVVLVRAPSRFDLYRDPRTVNTAIGRLARTLHEQGVLTDAEAKRIHTEIFKLEPPSLPVGATHFVRHVTAQSAQQWQPSLRTTLNGTLQSTLQTLLDQRLAQLTRRSVRHGAVLVADHTTGEILAWVVAGEPDESVPGSFIDTVTTPRQPGSSLKPFVYALALENGWTAATQILDAPLAESVGTGLHAYRNYSRNFYGPVTLRNALGNSLNIPAVRAAKFVGVENYHRFLQTLGFTTLDEHPDFYGDGLALGNGEVTLYELVQAYSALAHGGVWRPLTPWMNDPAPREEMRVVSGPVASLIANILSDPEARRLEFGAGSVLNLPVQTAVKTGTSTDYRDAWAVGFNDRYTVGVWMGNLDQNPMEDVTGSTGPALLLRSVFAELNRHRETRPLYIDPRLVQRDLCREPQNGVINVSLDDESACRWVTEWFVPGTEPQDVTMRPYRDREVKWVKPVWGLRMAMDPRIPDEHEAFEFAIQGVEDTDTVEWNLNGTPLAVTEGGKYLWNLERGRQHLTATIHKPTQPTPQTLHVVFYVK